MKDMKIKNIWSLVAAAVVLVSCGDKMDYKEYSVYDEDYVKTTFARSAGLVTSAYNDLDYDFGNYSGALLASATDEAVYSHSGNAIEKFYDGGWSASSNNDASLWTKCWRGISYANLFLDKFKDETFEDYILDLDYKAEIHQYQNLQYEARFLRAYYYFLLVRSFGGVPLITANLDANEANTQPRVSSDEIFQFIISECAAIQDLIVMAGGLRDQASLAKVEVSRRILDPYATAKSNVIAKTFTFDLKDGLVMTGSQGFVLEPYDVVHVYRSPAFSAARNISVRGEVNYEGNFTLPTKKIRISDALKMAGGITDAAYLRGARLVRQMNAEERMRAQSTVKALRSILTERGDSLSMQTLAAAENTYLVGIDLEAAVKHPGSDKDLLMREGDELFIPEYCGMVRISGDVFYPNVVTYEEGKSAKYYVNEAGGYGNRAKKSKTFIVYQNGNVGVVSKGAKPEPGCEIIVPSKKRRTPINLAGITGIGTSLASLATLIIALTKL